MKLDRKFIERLATYLIGIAIGLVLVGLLQSARQRAQNPQAPSASEQAQPEGAGGD